MSGKLLVGSMPIGNMDDISVRMIDAFQNSTLILSDTPTDYLQNILNKYNIIKPIEILKSTNTQFADIDQVNKITQMIKDGETVLLISSEGQVGIADPGNQFIQSCIKNNLKYTVLPGPNCFINAYVLSGYIDGDFFVSSSMDDQIKYIKSFKDSNHPIILLVWYDEIFKILEFMKNNYNDEKYATLCVNMTLEDEFIIYDKANNIINNEKIKLLQKSSKIALIVSGKLEVDFRTNQ
jgi:16S rRNA (cytidine1402-2'-O)-methyltransferase